MDRAIDMIRSSPWLVALLAALLILAGVVLHARLARAIERARIRRRYKQGARGEVRARKCLERLGYTILAEQATLATAMRIDGKVHSYRVAADFIVERRGKRAVVDAKTGSAANPLSRDTRRQLFEYAALYETNNLFVYDGNRDQLIEVAFSHAFERRSPARWLAAGIGLFVAGVVVGVSMGGLC